MQKSSKNFLSEYGIANIAILALLIHTLKFQLTVKGTYIGVILVSIIFCGYICKNIYNKANGIKDNLILFKLSTYTTGAKILIILFIIEFLFWQVFMLLGRYLSIVSLNPTGLLINLVFWFIVFSITTLFITFCLIVPFYKNLKLNTYFKPDVLNLVYKKNILSVVANSLISILYCIAIYCICVPFMMLFDVSNAGSAFFGSFISSIMLTVIILFWINIQARLSKKIFEIQ